MTPYPLAWPEHVIRWRGARQPGQFKTTLVSAMNNVSDSLRRFGTDSGKAVTDLVISSNVTLGRNNPDDPGVAIWFKWDGLSVCIPVDRYSKVEANLQAIHHIIEARRTELRHGTLALVRATFTGFTALPWPPGSAKRPWRRVLNFNETWIGGKSEVEVRYRQLANERHPDKGGSNEAMAELNGARTAALRELA
jgi:hypothetical protein